MAFGAARRVRSAIAAAALAAPLLCAPAAAADERPARTVLAVYFGPEDFPANVLLDAAIRQTLTSRTDLDVDYFAEYLEADQFASEDASRALAGYVAGKYRGRRFDVVIAVTDMALEFVLRHRDRLFAGAPVVFFGLAAPDAHARAAAGGIAVVKTGQAYAETLRVALTLHPSTERVFVVASAPSGRSVERARAELANFSRRLSLTFVDEPTVPRLMDIVRLIPPRSLILYLWQRREAGEATYPDEIARRTAAAAAVPVYTTVDVAIGSGVVGGIVRDTPGSGRRVGDAVLAILDGVRAADIPVETAPVVPIFDWRQLRRWNVAASRLPPGSDIRFRVPTAWESYRPYFLGTLAVVVAQMLLIGGLLTQRASRRRAEAAVRASEASLRASFEQVRHLAGRLLEAQEATRAEVARELHDDVCQELVGVSMAVSSLSRSSGVIEDPAAREALETLQALTSRAVESARRVSHELHPATLRLLGLAAALQAHCVEVEKRHDVQVGLATTGNLRGVPTDVALCLFRIVQEALRNSAVHGEARRLQVSVVESASSLSLMIADDGRGFDLACVRRTGRGLGLVSMAERARLAGGELAVLTSPGQGTTIRVRIPARALAHVS